MKDLPVIPEPSLKADDMLKEVMLMQPNNLTFAQYSLTPIQENVLTLVVDALQAHISKTKILDTDLFNQPYIDIRSDEAAGVNHKARLLKELEGMVSKGFSFDWKVPNSKQEVKTSGTIVTSWHDYKNTNLVRINFNIWAIPFLLYYGVGVGGTRYVKKIALSLRNNYTKRIYKMISRWKDKTEFTMGLVEFRLKLEIPESYTTDAIKRRILNPSVTRIKDSGSDVTFDYELFTKAKKRGQKQKFDSILFIIKTKAKPSKEKVGDATYNYLYYWLTNIYGKESPNIVKALNEINNQGAAQKIYDRCKYIEGLLNEGKLDSQNHANNSIRKYLRESFKINMK